MILVYIFCFFVSIFFALLFTPVAIFLSRKFNVYDMPNRRKVHTRPIPRWGGLGIFLSISGCLLLVYYLFPQFSQLLASELKQKSKLIGTLTLFDQLMGILTGGVFVLILGMIDDKKNVQALIKLLVQIIAALCALEYGVRIFGLTIPFFNTYIELPIILTLFITVLWLVSFMNTINLADGLDGLATGLVTIAAGTFFIVSMLMKPTLMNSPDKLWLANQLQLSAILSITLCGAGIGFLFFNFNPARIFVGDGGALFMGFMLASISIIGTLKMPLVVALFIPIIIVALPVLDVFLSILRRFSRGGDIMAPDKEHIHHRLLKLGWTHREVVFIMYVITLILSIVTISLTSWKLTLR
ncbi:MAG: undecaprenyl/decaprenyl-phosphate alpha-N-acetylglucosaminyl 1-phosphate transferase [Elusimicrobia bacterium]|nr:undecaprenyl/decaprenyl-phosphate alpha-N-acetylglucosaminyl 1-phosphate transferase [Elusimicrobiota bacterium]